MRLEVRLYATLRRYHPEQPDGKIACEMPSDATVLDTVNALKIDPAEIHLIMVNGVGSELNQLLHENDRLGLFPPIGGG